MKKTNKILLSILTVFSMLFTMLVNAEELSEMERNIANAIPDTISISMKESDVNVNDEYSIDKAQQLAYNEIKSILEKANIDMETVVKDGDKTTTTSISVGFDETCYYDGRVVGASAECISDIHTMDVDLYQSTETSGSHSSSGGKLKSITIKYSDTTEDTNILNYLTDTITLDIKESEVDLNIEYDHVNSTLSKIEAIIKSQLAEKGYEVSDMELIFANAASGFEPGDIHKVHVSMGNLGKDIKIIYSNTSQYNEKDAAYVKNIVDGLKFANYGGLPAVFTVYNLGDEESASKWTENTYDFSTLLNDDSIVLKRTLGAGGLGGGTPWGVGNILYFYKNDVLYASKFIMNMGAYGTTLENGTPVNMLRLEQDDETYKEMAKELEKNGLKNIIGCYELEAYGETYDNMQVSFNIGTKYNGKEVQILHKKSDGTYEIFKATVKDGKATITVSEFSPFMIALSGSSSSNNAQTSSMNVIVYAIFALSSLLGIAYLLVSKKKNKKKEIA